MLGNDLVLNDLIGHARFRHTMGQGMVKHSNFIELAIAAEVIRMRVRVDYHHGFVGDCLHGLAQIANSTAGINERGPFSPNEQIHDGLLIMTRFVENKKAGCDLVSRKPIVRGGNLFEIGPT